MPWNPPTVVLLVGALATAASAQEIGDSSPDGLWRQTARASAAMQGTATTADGAPQGAGSLHQLDRSAFDARLSSAPHENTTRVEVSPAVISLPMPDGSYPRFAIVESPIMEPALAARFPEIRTYALAGVDDPSMRGRLDASPAGIHAMVLTRDRPVLIDPAAGSRSDLYASHADTSPPVQCAVEEARRVEPDSPVADSAGDGAGAPWVIQAVTNPSGDTLRTYRIAIATTGEYYQARGNNDLAVLLSIVVVMNRVNLVYQTEVAVSFVLAADTTDLFFTDPDTDGYTNNTECTMRGENVTVIGGILDDDAYDVGHVFGSGAGGCAGGANVCGANKANGASNLNTNPALAIDHEGFSGYKLVSHELGHQFGAGHTWSGTGGNCTAGQFAANSAYEPAGGTTLMSYSGTCGVSSNIQTTAADPYFLTHSFDQITAFVSSGNGSTCGTAAATGNTAPDVSAGSDYTIPRRTPFVLTGSAVDADGDDLVYTWEQYDLAPGQFIGGTDPGSGPLFRSFPPGPDPSRTFPQLSDIVNNTTTLGELLPQLFDRVGDPLTFRLTARDQRVTGGGADYDSVEITVQGAPFRVTRPTALMLFEAGCTEEVTWDLGGGIANQVDISISSDGGFTYSPLALGVPNDGSHEVQLTCDTSTTEGRMKVAAVDNIFFDISNTNFVVGNNPPEIAAEAQGGAVDGSCQFTATFTATITDACGINADTVTVDAVVQGDNADLSNLTFNPQQVDQSTVQVDGSVMVSNVSGGPATVLFDIAAADTCGLAGGVVAEAQVVDDVPPTIDVALSPALLWPANHKMVSVTATVVAADNCPGVSYVLTSVTSSEPDDAVMGGDGATSGDIQGVEIGSEDTSFDLRAERLGSGDGRTYTAVYTALDASGHQTDGAAVVHVPVSQGPN